MILWRVLASLVALAFAAAIGWVIGVMESAYAYEEPDCLNERRHMHEYVAKVINVVDGDTIDAVIDLGFKISTSQRLRLARVDTPERNQEGYAEAKAFTASLVEGKEVIVKTTKVSKWGYYLADVTVGGIDVSNALIEAHLGKLYDGVKK